MKNNRDPNKIIKIGQQQVLPDNTVMMPVILRGGYGIKNIQIEIRHKDSNMAFLRMEKTRQTQLFQDISAEQKGNGTLLISGRSNEGIQTIGEGALIRLYFLVKTKFSPLEILSATEDLSEFTVE